MDTVKRKALVVHLGLESAAVLPRITGAWNAAALPGVHLEHLIIGRSSITKAHAPAGEGLRTEEILYAAKGAGAAQKAAFSYAQSGSFDVVITVRTPELAPKDLERMLACFDGPGCDAVIAVSAGSARLSDRFLTALQNALLKRNIADFYSDARAFSVKILSAIPFDYNSNGDEFDVQVLIQLTDISARLAQIGAETGKRAARTLRSRRKGLVSVIVSRIHKMSLWYHPQFDYTDANKIYTAKFGYNSSHQFALDAVPSGSVALDLGCGPGYMSARLRAKNVSTVSLDRHISDEVRKFSVKAIESDVEGYDFSSLHERVNYVLVLDLIEHLHSPETFLKNIRENLPNKSPRLIITTGNIAFIVTRLLLLAGKFNYGKKGILDMDHKRLFTFASLKDLLVLNGYAIVEVRGIPAPFPVALGDTGLARFLLSVNAFLIRIFRNLFSYQIAVVAQPEPAPQLTGAPK